MSKKEEFEKMDAATINKLVSLSWLCISSGMDATNQLDEYMTKFGFRGLFYQDLTAIRRDYELYAKKIRGSISDTQTREYFKDFDSFNAMKTRSGLNARILYREPEATDIYPYSIIAQITLNVVKDGCDTVNKKYDKKGRCLNGNSGWDLIMEEEESK